MAGGWAGSAAAEAVASDTGVSGVTGGAPGGRAATTPSGGGLHLTTTYDVDALGRTTKVTDPNGRIDYTVYDDVNHETRSYTGWDSSAHTATGPTTVYREDWANGYTETLTMSASRAPGLRCSLMRW